MKKYDVIVYKTMFYTTFHLHEKAIQTIHSQVKEITDKREKSSLYIQMGLIYHKLGKNNDACKYLIKGLQQVEHDFFEYHPEFPQILDLICKHSTPTIAEHWRTNFYNRIREDKRFKKCFKEKFE